MSNIYQNGFSRNHKVAKRKKSDLKIEAKIVTFNIDKYLAKHD